VLKELKIFEVEEFESVAGLSKHSDITFTKILIYNPVITGTGSRGKVQARNG
jgi:hypothetical protein